MRKYCSTILISVAVVFVILAPKAHADDSVIYKCTLANGAVKFQDFACKEGSGELVAFANNVNPDQSVSNGLREHEVKALDRMHALQLQHANKDKARAPVNMTVPANTSNNNNAVVHIYQQTNKSKTKQTGFVIKNQ